jgi:hypothetical protein
MAALGLANHEWTKHRAMLPRYIFKIPTESIDTFRKNVGSLTINGVPLEALELGDNIIQIKLGHCNLVDETTIVRLNGDQRSLAEIGLVNIAIQDETGSYAYHVPQGILVVYDPSDRTARDCGTLSTQEIAPTLLRNFGVPRPGYMRTGLM